MQVDELPEGSAPFLLCPGRLLWQKNGANWSKGPCNRVRPQCTAVLTLLAKGAMDADLPWKCGYILHMYHFHHPWTHRGYLTYKSAADVLARLFTTGQNFWTYGRQDRALYQLGRMLHLIQDIFIPHHGCYSLKWTWSTGKMAVRQLVSISYRGWRLLFLGKNLLKH